MAGQQDAAPGPAWFGWAVAGAALVQLALFVTAVVPGLAGTSDSTLYLHAAGTLRTAGVLLNPDGSPYRYWPPLYPVLLALGGSAGAARALQGLSLLSSLLAWSWLGRRLLPAGAARVLPWALALSTPWLLVSKFVWSEPVFLALFAGYAVALHQALRTRRGGWWALAAGLGSLLPLARTAGFFILLGVGVGLMLNIGKTLPRQRWWQAGHLLAAAVAGIAWHVYALLLAAPTVYRLNRGWPQFFDSMADYGFVLGRWLLPLRAAWRPGLPLLWALALVALLAWLWPRRTTAAPTRPAPAAPASALDTDALFRRLLWWAATAFLLLLLVATTFTRSASGLHDGERYASVLVGPVLLLALHHAAQLAPGRSGAGAGRWGRLGAMGLLTLWLAYQATRAATNAAALRRLPAVSWPANVQPKSGAEQ